MVVSCYYLALVLTTLLTATTASICLVNHTVLPAAVLQSQGNQSPACGAGIPQAVHSQIRSQVHQQVLIYLQRCRQASPSADITSTSLPIVPSPTPLTPGQSTCICPPSAATEPPVQTSTAILEASQEISTAAITHTAILVPTQLPVASPSTVSPASPTTELPATTEVLEVTSVTVTPTPTFQETLFPTATPIGSGANLPESCLDLATEDPSTPSGEYWIQPNTSQPAVLVYCKMNHTMCCNATNSTGWMQAAYLDTTESGSNTKCPGDWTLFRTSAEHVCGRDRSVRGCSSAVFPVYGVEYSQVCGRINAYEHEIPNGFTGDSQRSDINLPYLDGVSITNGELTRQHIWSFASQYYNDRRAPIPEILAIVGDDFFCDNPDNGSFDGGANIVEDPLWDGIDCSVNNPPCCTAAPWFCKELDEPAMSDIEVRMCGDSDEEDTPIFLMEIYVR